MENNGFINEIIEKIASKENHGYGKWILPCALDQDISNITNEFIKLDEIQRDEFRHKFTSIEHFGILRTFSERMSILAVREKNSKLIFEGLIAHAIEDFRFDYRENILILKNA